MSKTHVQTLKGWVKLMFTLYKGLFLSNHRKGWTWVLLRYLFKVWAWPSLIFFKVWTWKLPSLLFDKFFSYMGICNFLKCEIGNESSGFSKSLMPKTRQITCLGLVIWQDFLAFVIWKNPYSHFLLTVFSHYCHHLNTP